MKFGFGAGGEIVGPGFALAFLAARSCSTRRVCSHSTMDPWLNQAMRKKAGSRKSWFRVPKAHRLSKRGRGEEGCKAGRLSVLNTHRRATVGGSRASAPGGLDGWR